MTYIYARMHFSVIYGYFDSIPIFYSLVINLCGLKRTVGLKEIIYVDRAVLSLMLNWNSIITPIGWTKNEATLHFAGYLENYQRYLHDFYTHQG